MKQNGPRLLTLALAALLAVPGFAEDTTDAGHLEKIGNPDKVDEAVNKGLAYLVSKQDPVTGSFGGDKPNTFTGLSCMALMAAGHFPGRSNYGENLKKGIMYLARATEKHKGYLGNESNARMYGHGICTVALCEAYGMMKEEKENQQIKKAIDRALRVILNAQCKQKSGKLGGWRYDPRPGDVDLSVSAWQVLALRAAQNCQLDVPDKAIEESLLYLRKSFNPQKGAFTYQLGRKDTPAMRAAGVVSMLALGANKTESDRKMTERSAEYLMTCDPRRGSHFYYQTYYMATAANMMGKKHRDRLLPEIEKALLSLQTPTGEFKKHSGHQAGVYSTAFSVISLCVTYQYLPIYQE